MRVALGVAYDGTRFHGFQAQQPGIATIQGELERAIGQVANEAVRVTCAGRTDARVHATHQVVHFDTNAARPLRAWIYGVNANLPTSVSITWSRAVNDDFSARFSAISRRYLYLIDVSELRHALFANAITRDRRHHLDPDLMGEAGQALVGEHDFSSFRSAHCQSRSPVRTINRLTVTRRGDVVALDIAANAFLHHMVRNVAGVLMDIGAGEQPKDWTRDLLKARDRTVASVTAPPEGLYLIDVNYPPMHALPTGPALPRLLSLLDL